MTNYADQFVALEGTYLLSHSVGRPPVTTSDALHRNFLLPWMAGDAEVWPSWLACIEEFRRAVARLLNTTAALVCPQVNLSSAVTKVLGALPRSSNRSKILLSEDDFPSMAYVLQQATHLGYQLAFIPRQENTLDLDVWRHYLTDDVAFTLVTHVHSNSSRLQPVSDIVQLARERSILSLLDIAQSVGAVPIDLTSINADFAVGSCVKWLCGGPGAGFLWVNADILQRCQPTDVGWFSHENPFEFDIHQFRYASDALRFWGGTPSVTPYAVAVNSIAVVSNIGVDTIRAHNQQLTQQIIDAVDPAAVISPLAPETRGGTLVLHFGEQQKDIVARLKHANVHFDNRATGMRLSPHIYNSMAEINAVIARLPTH
jgi:kynureninase